MVAGNIPLPFTDTHIHAKKLSLTRNTTVVVLQLFPQGLGCTVLTEKLSIPHLKKTLTIIKTKNWHLKLNHNQLANQELQDSQVKQHNGDTERAVLTVQLGC